MSRNKHYSSGSERNIENCEDFLFKCIEILESRDVMRTRRECQRENLKLQGPKWFFPFVLI